MENGKAEKNTVFEGLFLSKRQHPYTNNLTPKAADKEGWGVDKSGGKKGGRTHASLSRKKEKTNAFPIFCPPSSFADITARFSFHPFLLFFAVACCSMRRREGEKSVTRELGGRAIKMPRLSTLSSFLSLSLSLACAKFRWVEYFAYFFFPARLPAWERERCAVHFKG